MSVALAILLAIGLGFGFAILWDAVIGAITRALVDLGWPV